MPCPTCSKTMQRIGASPGPYDGIFWCPICGTVMEEGCQESTSVPELVPRVRLLLPEPHTDPLQEQICHRLGIYEAVYSEEQRRSRAL